MSLFDIYIRYRIVMGVARAFVYLVKLPFRMAAAGYRAATTSSAEKRAKGSVVGHVADGDTISIKTRPSKSQDAPVEDIRIRLAWMDAPEHGQQAKNGSDAGEASKRALMLIAPKDAPCEVKAIDTDVYGRTVAVVTIDGIDLGLSQIRNGQAIALEGAPRAYVEAEKKARAEKLGVWGAGGLGSNGNESPKEFRRENPWEPEKEAAARAKAERTERAEGPAGPKASPKPKAASADSTARPRAGGWSR